MIAPVDAPMDTLVKNQSGVPSSIIMETVITSHNCTESTTITNATNHINNQNSHYQLINSPVFQPVARSAPKLAQIANFALKYGLDLDPVLVTQNP